MSHYIVHFAKSIGARTSAPKLAPSERGFIAVMSVIIITAILLVLVFTLGVTTFFSRFDILDAENKRTSLGLAEGCVNAAMLKVAQDSGYAPASGGDCVSMGGACGGSDPQNVCRICQVTHGANSATASVRARYNHAYTNISVTFDTTPGNIAVTDWNETADYAGPTCIVP